jgi:hypothetical protein
LAAFDFSIQHRLGKTNPADSPSRRPDYKVEAIEDVKGPANFGDLRQTRLLKELQHKLQLNSLRSGQIAPDPPRTESPRLVAAARTVVPGQPLATRATSPDGEEHLLEGIIRRTPKDPEAAKVTLA